MVAAKNSTMHRRETCKDEKYNDDLTQLGAHTHTNTHLAPPTHLSPGTSPHPLQHSCNRFLVTFLVKVYQTEDSLIALFRQYHNMIYNVEIIVLNFLPEPN